MVPTCHLCRAVVLRSKMGREEGRERRYYNAVRRYQSFAVEVRPSFDISELLLNEAKPIRAAKRTGVARPRLN